MKKTTPHLSTNYNFSTKIVATSGTIITFRDQTLRKTEIALTLLDNKNPLTLRLLVID